MAHPYQEFPRVSPWAFRESIFGRLKFEVVSPQITQNLFKKDVKSKNRSYIKKYSTRRFLVSTRKVNDHRKNV